MKFEIDASIFTTAGGAFGRVHGAIELDETPQVGDTISFAFPNVRTLPPVKSFTGVLRVKDRIFTVGSGHGRLYLALENLTLPSLEDARAVAQYLEAGFGLFVDPY